MPELPQQIAIDDVTLTLSVERKRMKNVNARLRSSALHISAPPSMSPERLETIASDLARKLLKREHARQVNDEEDELTLATSVAGRFPQPPQVDRGMFVTNQRACWSSCSQRTNTFRLNAALHTMPRWVLESVVAHELAHAIHPDQSPAFWELLHSVYPETERAMAFLEGVGWLAGNRESISSVELAQLIGGGSTHPLD